MGWIIQKSAAPTSLSNCHFERSLMVREADRRRSRETCFWTALNTRFLDCVRHPLRGWQHFARNDRTRECRTLRLRLESIQVRYSCDAGRELDIRNHQARFLKRRPAAQCG